MQLQIAKSEDVAKVNELLNDLRHFVQEMLEGAIDRTKPHWWGLYVEQSLYPKPRKQTEHGLHALDLPELLRVLTKKWPDLHVKLCMPRESRDTAFNLMQIRHHYSHLDGDQPSDLDVLVALHGIHAFAKEFSAPAATQNKAAREVEAAVRRLNTSAEAVGIPREVGEDFTVKELMENLRQVLKDIQQDKTPLARQVEVKCIDTQNAHPLTPALKGSSPKGISIQQRVYGANSWKAVYQRLLEDLVRVNQSLFEQLPQNTDFRGKGNARYFTVQGDHIHLRDASKPFTPTKVKAELEIGTLDFYDAGKRVQRLLKLFGVPVEEVLILL